MDNGIVLGHASSITCGALWVTDMRDIKLFSIDNERAVELTGAGEVMERSLQRMFEANLEKVLGVRFLATEYSTGPVHGGRIDTLGLDENGCPVIIEYKRSINENVINQGLFYLDWLLDHRMEFQWRVMDKLGEEAARSVDWTAPRLVCIAGDFTRYDEHAVKQISRNIELIRYRKFDSGLLMIEQVHAPKASRSPSNSATLRPDGASPQPATPAQTNLPKVETVTDDLYASQRIAYRIANAPPELRDLYDSLSVLLSGLGDDVQVKELKNYIAFKRLKNFACVEVFPQTKVVSAYLKLDPQSVALEPGFTRDVSKVGHFGTGDLEVSLRDAADLVRAQPLLQRAYDRS